MGPLLTTICIGLGVGAIAQGVAMVRRDMPAPVVCKPITASEVLAKQHARDYTRALPVDTIDPAPVANDIGGAMMVDDCISALRNLGMTKARATSLTKATRDMIGGDPSLSELIKACIKSLNPH